MPAIETVRSFINLSNGIECLASMKEFNGYVRIQSTACEQKRWWFILSELDYSFLIPVACGLPVRVWDASPKKGMSRAIYQGLEWIKYALWRAWYGHEYRATVRGNNVSKFFYDAYYSAVTPKDSPLLTSGHQSIAVGKLEYVKRIAIPPDRCLGIDLEGVCMIARNDGKQALYDMVAEIN